MKRKMIREVLLVHALYPFVAGLLVVLGTLLTLGVDQAIRLPGGSIAAGLFMGLVVGRG